MRFSLSLDDGGDLTVHDDLEQRPPPSDRTDGPVAMPVLNSTVDPTSDVYGQNRLSMEAALAEVGAQLDIARGGGGERYVERHRERGKFLARERIELLLDRDAPFLELAPLAAWGTDYTVGASLVAGIGVVHGVECMVSANDPTVRGGSTNPYTMRKSSRLADIALENRLPSISLVESGGADLPTQSEIFIPGGRGFRDLTQRSAAGLPTISLVFGNSTAGGAYVPGMSDYIVMIEGRSKVFLGGPPLVKMATGEESDDESLGGAEMHARVSGLADYMATDELDAIRLGRDIVARLNWRKLGRGPSMAADEPLFDADELLGVASADLRVPFDPRDVLARVVDGSCFDEFKPLYGPSLVTGWASIHGYPIGVLANHRGVLFSEESNKATQFIQLANQIDVPLLFLQNTTGYMVGKQYEQRGIIKDGAKMINAVSNSHVPHLTVNIGASYGAGNYGMCGRAYNPRFLFSWPNARSAVMGPAQLAGVLSIVARQSADARGLPFDEEADGAMRAAVEAQIEAESLPLFLTARLYDDGIIDPRDTRTVLGFCLSVIDNTPIHGTRGYGVFRM
jgi:acetyl-CoA carboxylase carboxyltransferase component